MSELPNNKQASITVKDKLNWKFGKIYFNEYTEV